MGSSPFLLTLCTSNFLPYISSNPTSSIKFVQTIKGQEKCKTRENSNLLENDKMVISVKIRNFSRSRMIKQTSPLELSREI